jgi:hypothetical protein
MSLVFVWQKLESSQGKRSKMSLFCIECINQKSINMRNLLLPLFAVLILASCQQKPSSASFSSKSPDGMTTISVTGKKEVALDPFTVVLAVRTGDTDEGSLTFEIAADQLTDTNVKFKWADSQNCRISFTQTDGGERAFMYYADGNNVIIKEVKNE